MELTTLYESLGVSRAVYEYGEMILDGLRPRFEAIDRTADKCVRKNIKRR